jgi:hypothetical protein
MALPKVETTRHRLNQSAAQPPLTTIAEPVIEEDASEGQEHDRPHQFLDLPYPPELDPAQDPATDGFIDKEATRKGCFYEGRADCVHANPVRAKVDRHSFGHAFHSVFGRTIHCTVGTAHQTHVR